MTKAKTKVEPGYFTRFEPGTGFDLDNPSIRRTISPQICWRNADGSVDVAMNFGGYYDNGDLSGFKRRMQGKMNIQLGRFRSHLARTGKRWEVEQRQKYQREQARKKAKSAAGRAAFQAGAAMETPLPVEVKGLGTVRPHSLSDAEIEALIASLVSEARRRAVIEAINQEKD